MEEFQDMSQSVGSTRGRFATARIAFRPLLFCCGAVVVVGSLALGCTLNPVVTVPQTGSNHYDACEQAAQNYCEQVVKAGDGELEGCVAKYTFQCISGTSD
jgi:hypothetical protein